MYDCFGLFTEALLAEKVSIAEADLPERNADGLLSPTDPGRFVICNPSRRECIDCADEAAEALPDKFFCLLGSSV